MSREFEVLVIGAGTIASVMANLLLTRKVTARGGVAMIAGRSDRAAAAAGSPPRRIPGVFACSR